MALGYGTRDAEPGSPEPAFIWPAQQRIPPAEDASSDRSERKSKRGRKDNEKKEDGKKGKKKPAIFVTAEQAAKRNPYDTSARVVIVTKEVQDKMIAERRAKVLSVAGLFEAAESKAEVIAVVDDLEELNDISDLPELKDFDDYDGNADHDEKGVLAMVGRVAGSVVAIGEATGVVAVGKWSTEKPLNLMDWLGRKLDSWGDNLLKKADMGFPFGPLAQLTAGIMDWTAGKILSKESLADLLKKEKEEKQKALDKALKQLGDDRAKMEKKKDDAAKKEKAKKEKEEKRIQDLVAKGIDEDLAKVLAEGAEPDEAEEKEEPKAE